MELMVNKTLSTMPRAVEYRVKKQLRDIKGGVSSLKEVRLIRGIGSSVVIENKSYKLYLNITRDELEGTLYRLTGGSLYTHKDTISRGYISLSNGVRVGVCGEAKYENENLVCIDDISTLIYRFHGVESSLTEELYEAYSSAKSGMLIYSVAGGGKTTALRTLSKTIAKREWGTRIAVIDEREEFNKDECENLGIALLRGYRRAHGMDIALRTLGVSLIVVDEIGSEDESYSIRQFLLSGAKFIATAHARELGELVQRDALFPYIEKGVFDVFFGIFNTDGNYFCKVDKM